jgi:hypothetical protein
VPGAAHHDHIPTPGRAQPKQRSHEIAVCRSCRSRGGYVATALSTAAPAQNGQPYLAGQVGAFLASPLSRAITGESIGTGGGKDRAITI